MEEKIEVDCVGWSSSLADEELHFYVAGTVDFVAGFSPKHISQEQIKKLLRECNMKVLGYRDRDKPFL